MKDLNLVPGFPTDLIKKLMPHQPISIHLNESGVLKHNKEYVLDPDLWEEIENHVYGSVSKNLLFLLSDDLLKELSGYSPIKIKEVPSGYTLTGKYIFVSIYRNGDYKGEGIDNIDGKLWTLISRELNEVTRKSKVDEFASHMVLDHENQDDEMKLTDYLNKMDKLRDFLYFVGYDLNKITLTEAESIMEHVACLLYHKKLK